MDFCHSDMFFIIANHAARSNEKMQKNWAPRLCRKLYGAQGVYWTIRSKEDLETAEREGAIAIFERFIP